MKVNLTINTHEHGKRQAELERQALQQFFGEVRNPALPPMPSGPAYYRINCNICDADTWVLQGNYLCPSCAVIEDERAVLQRELSLLQVKAALAELREEVEVARTGRETADVLH